MNGDVMRTVIPELSPDPSKRLGRHIVHDPRSRNFPAEGWRRRSRVSCTAHTGLPLDEGVIG